METPTLTLTLTQGGTVATQDVAGSQKVVVGQGDDDPAVSGGSISREQAARLLIVAALTLRPQAGHGLVFEAAAAPGVAQQADVLDAALQKLRPVKA